MTHEHRFEPGWLMRQCYEAKVECWSSHAPAFYSNKIRAPATEEEQRDLFEKMEKRFRQWTGKSLAGFASGQSAQGSKE